MLINRRVPVSNYLVTYIITEEQALVCYTQEYCQQFVQTSGAPSCSRVLSEKHRMRTCVWQYEEWPRSSPTLG